VQLTRTLEVKVANFMFREFVQRNCGRGQCFFKCEPNFINALICMLKEIYLMPGEEFVRVGDVARELYFVADGVVKLMEGAEVQREIRGEIADMANVIGEVSFFLGIQQAQTARASSDSEVRLLVLGQQSSGILKEP
jgi:hypothetical protein